MKKIITGLVVGALCCTLFSTPAFPSKYDPNRPPPTPYANIGTGNSTDDGGWEEVLKAPSPPGRYRIFEFLERLISFNQSPWFPWLSMISIKKDNNPLDGPVSNEDSDTSRDAEAGRSTSTK